MEFRKWLQIDESKFDRNVIDSPDNDLAPPDNTKPKSAWSQSLGPRVSDSGFDASPDPDEYIRKKGNRYVPPDEIVDPKQRIPGEDFPELGLDDEEDEEPAYDPTNNDYDDEGRYKWSDQSSQELAKDWRKFGHKFDQPGNPVDPPSTFGGVPADDYMKNRVDPESIPGPDTQDIPRRSSFSSDRMQGMSPSGRPRGPHIGKKRSWKDQRMTQAHDEPESFSRRVDPDQIRTARSRSA